MIVLLNLAACMFRKTVGEAADPDIDCAGRLQLRILRVEFSDVLDLCQQEDAILIADILHRNVPVGAHLCATLVLERK